MSISIPTIDECSRMSFADLAHKIEDLLGQAKEEPDRFEQDDIRRLIDALEGKLPDSPRQPSLETPPDPSEFPEEPKVIEVDFSQYSPSLRYAEVRQHHDSLISQLEAQKRAAVTKGKRKELGQEIMRAKREKDLSLLQIKLAELPGGLTWRKQMLAHQEWEKARSLMLNNQAAVNIRNEQKLADWNARMAAWRRKHETPLRIIENLRQDIDAVFYSVRQGWKRLPWRLLPPSEMTQKNVIGAVREYHQRRPELQIDESRLSFAYSLNPDDVYIGEDEFDGYFAFVFKKGRCVLLENPVEGNAAYVFGEDWKRLSRLSKLELLDNYRHRLVRVIHRTRWRSEIPRALTEFD